jgi:hypothetical protein
MSAPDEIAATCDYRAAGCFNIRAAGLRPMAISFEQKRDLGASQPLSCGRAGIAGDGRAGFDQQWPPSLRNNLDLRQNFLFFLRRNVRPRVSEPVQLILELGPKLPAPECRPNCGVQLLHPPVCKIVQHIEHDPSRQDDGATDDRGLE